MRKGSIGLITGVGYARNPRKAIVELFERGAVIKYQVPAVRMAANRDRRCDRGSEARGSGEKQARGPSARFFCCALQLNLQNVLASRKFGARKVKEDACRRSSAVASTRLLCITSVCTAARPTSSNAFFAKDTL